MLSVFLSGAAGLVYQIVWLRKLSLHMGATSYALSAVLAAFMGGMALGSRLLGPLADRPGARPARIYALLQLGILASAPLAYILPGLLDAPLGLAYRAMGPGPGVNVLRFLAALLALAAPTMLMGATIPVLTRGLAPARGVERGLSAVYALNTGGAVGGTLAAGFLLVPELGLLGTMGVAMLLSLSAAAFAGPVVLLGVHAAAGGKVGAPTGEPDRDPRPLIAGTVVGFVMLAAEVVWTGSLVTGIFNNTYAVSTMLAAVLLGIAVGSWLTGRLRLPPRPTAMACLALLSVWVPLSGLYMRRWAGAFTALGEGSLAGLTVARYLPAFLVLLPATLASGALFPSLSTLYSPRPARSGGGVGRFAAANTAGAVAGSVLASFLLLPLLGRRLSYLVLGLLALGALAVMLRRRRLAWALPLLAAAGVALTLPAGGGERAGSRTLLSRDTPEGRVEVTQDRDTPSSLRLDIRGSQATTTTPEGCLKNRLMAYFPMLLHPSPEDVNVICFGTGITVGTVTLFECVDSVDCVEINPTVVEAARLFRPYNHDALADPRVRVLVEDGRNHLMSTARRYDVITMEPMHPALAGVVSLYTSDFYLLCRDRLRDGGLMAQWLPLYNLTPRDCHMVAATFLEVFPNATLWVLGRDAMLVGRKGEPVEPLNVLRGLARPGVTEDLEPFGLDDPAVYLASWVAGPEGVLEYCAGAPAVTDDHPLLEYTAPEAIFADSTTAPNLEEMLDLRERPPGAGELEGFGRAWRASGLFLRAEAARARRNLALEAELLDSAVSVCPEMEIAARRLSASIHQSARILLDRGEGARAWRMMEMALEVTDHPSPALLTDLSLLSSSAGMYGRARQLADSALAREPMSASAHRALGRAQLGLGRQERARRSLAIADSLDAD
jgi:spermidine synthase